MRSGRLEHRILFYAKVISRDSFSGSVDTWPAVTITTRGEVREVGGSKFLSNEEKFYSKNKEVTIRYNSAERVEIDTITLTGTSGTANVTVDTLTKLATFATDLETTAANFVTTHAAAYAARDITLTTAAGGKLVFTGQTAKGAFTGASTCANVSGNLAGTNADTQAYASVVETMKLKIDEETQFYIITYIEIIGRKEGMRLSIEKENT